MACLTREQARAQAEQQTVDAELQGERLRAVLSFLNLTSSEWINMCMAKAEKPRNWASWIKGIVQTQCSDASSTLRQHSSSGKKDKPGQAEEADMRAAYSAWKRNLRIKRLENMLWQEHDIEQALFTVWQAYCDRLAVAASNTYFMTITGFLRLLYDCCLLDNTTTPCQVDNLVSGAIYAPGQQRQDVKLTFPAFRDCLARVSLQRAAVKRAKHQKCTTNKPAPDIQADSFIQPFLDVTLPPAKLPAPPMVHHRSSAGLTNSGAPLLARLSSFSGAAGRPSFHPTAIQEHDAGLPIGRTLSRSISKVRYSESNPQNLYIDDANHASKEYKPDAPPQPRPLLKRLSSLKQSSFKDRPEPSSPTTYVESRAEPAITRKVTTLHTTYQAPAAVQQLRGLTATALLGDVQSGSSKVSTAASLMALHKFHTFVRKWVLPLALPTGMTKSSPLDGLFSRKSLNMLHCVEPGLRHVFAQYARLSDQQRSASTWLKVVTGHFTLDVRHLTEMMHNFKVSPCFLSRAAISEVYKTCPAQDARHGWFDGGLNYCRFLITLAKVSSRMVETLPSRMQVNATPEDLKLMRQLVTSFVPGATRDRLEAVLTHVEVARRRTLDDQGRSTSCMTFFDYQGLRLSAQQEQEQLEHTSAHLLHVLDRREEMRQKLALRRLHNFYADVRTCQSAPMPGSDITSQQPLLPALPDQASGFTALQVTESSIGGMGPKTKGKPRGSVKGTKEELTVVGGVDVAFFSDSIQIKTPKLIPHYAPGIAHHAQAAASPRAQSIASPAVGTSSHFRIDSSAQTYSSKERRADCSLQHPGLGRHSALSSEALNQHLSHLARGGCHVCDPLSSCTVEMLAIEARDESEVISSFTCRLPSLNLQQHSAANHATTKPQRATVANAALPLAPEPVQDQSRSPRSQSAGDQLLPRVASPASPVTGHQDSTQVFKAPEYVGEVAPAAGGDTQTEFDAPAECGGSRASSIGSSTDLIDTGASNASIGGRSRPKPPTTLPVLKQARPHITAVLADIMKAGSGQRLKQYSQSRLLAPLRPT